MSIKSTLSKIKTATGMKVTYGRSSEKSEPPFLVYMGAGQDDFLADGTIYEKHNNYRLELYFTKKDESLEEEIEKVLTDDGWIYEKTEDIYIESEDIFVIYYNV